MADSKITALTAISTVDPTADPLVIVDVSDTSMAASGTTKKSTINQLLGAGGTATLASATITGDLTVDTNTLKVDSANNRVGVNKSTPAVDLDVGGSARFQSAGTNWMEFGINVLTSNQATGASIRSVVSSAGNPTYSWTGDSDTGLFNDSANSIGFAIGGSEGMRLNATGLGVGTASHSTRLGVVDTVNTFAATFRGNLGTDFVAIGTTALGASINAYTAGFGAASNLVLQPNGGNVGIGVTPSAWFSTWKVLQLGGGSFGGPSDRLFSLQNAIVNPGGNFQYVSGSSTPASGYRQFNGAHDWYTAAAGTSPNTITDFSSPKMTLDASGNLLVARTGAGLDNTSGVTLAQASIGMQTEGNAVQLIMNRTTSDGAIVGIRRNNLTVGDISVTTTGTTYNTISDYRLKESVQPLVGGLARISALKPSVYKWKSDGSNGEGFLAHELAEVVPLAVTGEKDAVNDDGSIKAQGVDLSKVVPILVAAIQELTARVQTLETR